MRQHGLDQPPLILVLLLLALAVCASASVLLTIYEVGW